MVRDERRNAIIKIIAEREIETQEELAAALTEVGIPATQATLSRDIRNLRLIKIHGSAKRFKYALPAAATGEESDGEKILSLLKSTILSVKKAKNLIVIKTLTGGASTCGMGVDNLYANDIVGSIGGDDSLLIITESDEAAISLAAKIESDIKDD